MPAAAPAHRAGGWICRAGSSSSSCGRHLLTALARGSCGGPPCAGWERRAAAGRPQWSGAGGRPRGRRRGMTGSPVLSARRRQVAPPLRAGGGKSGARAAAVVRRRRRKWQQVGKGRPGSCRGRGSGCGPTAPQLRLRLRPPPPAISSAQPRR